MTAPDSLAELLRDQRATREEVREMRLVLTDAVAEMRGQRRELDQHREDDRRELDTLARRQWWLAVVTVALAAGGGGAAGMISQAIGGG